MKKLFILLLTILGFAKVFSQSLTEQEVTPPYNIKAVSFHQRDSVATPFFRLGDSFELQFDDLFGNEADYYYTITQYSYDWKPTNLAKVEYLQGMDNQRIITYENSFNTLQLYSHYVQTFPNRFNRITKSGNYMVKIFNDDKEIVFSRKFIIYEDIVAVPAVVRKSRNIQTIQEKQNLDFTINLGETTYQNPKQNIKVSIFQNARFDTAKNNIAPQYTIGNELVYRYNEETQFWGGNEFWNFENSTIRATSNSVLKYTAGDIYNTHLYANHERKNKIYTYYPDINGRFLVYNRGAENSSIQADYTWVYFTLDAATTFTNNSIYIGGMFNNYAKTDEYKMAYNKESGFYEKAVLIKQGFVNFEYTLTDKKGNVDSENAIDGNFYQTENQYNIVVYYRGNNDRYDRVIGNGMTTSKVIKN
ncbi:DUF5103 domain-containing protein [uncultured Flavobacterium sp.]|uniref:type IX secretion system plug protein n=1 Tax=uncultured Flavobacterium sp. TaxID=165435 RepID=UPI0030EC2C01|tara:strand:+ start:27504 stop:28757 length:1254 start_codon:yes stop_codon:yes gene_type:complete